MTINELIEILQFYAETEGNKEVKVEVTEDSRYVFMEDIKTVRMDSDGDYLELITE